MHHARHNPSSVIGASIPRIEDRPLLTGKGRFVDDISLPALRHCAFVRSTLAHAVIGNIDTSAAAVLPGVQAVMTVRDFMPVITDARMPLGAIGAGKKNNSTPFVLAKGEVAYVGEPIALVIAESRYVAEDAADLVHVDYEPLPVVHDARQAIEPGAPTVRRELSSNILNTLKVAYGDIDVAFGNAAHVFSDELLQHRGCGQSIEARGVLVEPRPSDGSLCVWSSTQMPNDVHAMLAQVLGIDDTLIRVITPDVGGGFGPKYCVYPEEMALAAAARLAGVPLKWIEDRRETFLASIQERDQYWTLQIAVDADAHILGIRGRLLHDQGAYAPKPVNLPYNSATAMSGPYIVPAYAMDVVIAHTNKVPVSSVRGAGYPQAAFAMERMLDLVANELGLDRAEVRRRNLIPPDKMPYKKPLSVRSGAAIVYDSGDYPAAQAKALVAADWNGFAGRKKAALAQGRHIGIGLANAVKGTGRGPFESGSVRVSPSGQVSIFTGAAAMGQGLATALAQICGAELGIAPENIRVVAGDTATSPLGLGGFASRQLVTAGSSVHLAAKSVAAKAKRLASHIMETAEDTLELTDGHVRVRGGNRSLSLAELAGILRGAPGYGFPSDIEPGLSASMHWRTDALAYANACHVAEVEVDVDCCAVRILRYVAFNDSGRMINPTIVEGQVVGGIVHGIGNALYELMNYDDNAQPLSTTFADYLLPSLSEVPSIECLYEETDSPMNPLGVKGVGEAGTIPAAAAILSAVEDALSPFGIRISRTPMRPKTLFEVIAAARSKHSSRPQTRML
ncbi:MAG TPA: xanthine dehydrogenase family protein molybdopterin-binding subunit [Bradyrhizobium sp.]|uniref:xanthine dehydrogenase family protein molybdopterin-binding subunit n=1 Tax=Bradyrhizobium sp. TaxID=376 RepID=UPI002B46E120|nr:xanthine dehydrogenase family protein molybdopterin-binding subunit [Bradyrhizobium sp.]HKO71423.1 xanthine dehydrogenase family protein molybdopterin-binding subunit [Bradyrhizobium sp.]